MTNNRFALDLGCGMAKVPGFVGLDRSPLPGVDVVANLDNPLPFDDNSVDIVFASHALEHVRDLMQTIKEIYRVCRDKAQVCIVAPYYSQGINFANPFHRQGFNEHTPRFWTPYPHSEIAAAEYKHPHAEPWGLSQSDHLDPGIDLRCLRMEFFYFPAYRDLPPEEQRAARKKYIDVCHQIVYHLLVVKESIGEREIGELAKEIEYFDPPAVALRRLQERIEFLEAKLGHALATQSAREAELAQTRTLLTEHEAELAQMRPQLTKYEAELAQTRTLLTEHEAELAQTRTSLTEREAALAQTRTLLTDHEAALVQSRTLLTERETQLQQVMVKGRAVANELGSYRNGRVMRGISHFFDNSDVREDIAPAFQQLKDDSLIFIRGLHGYHLQVSRNLQHLPYVQYPLDLHRPNLAGIQLAPILDFPASAGVIGIEIISPANTIVTQTVRALSDVDGSDPCRFGFAPIQDSGKGRYWLRVFVREADVPARVLEWRNKSVFGLWRPQTMVFCGFIFNP